MLEFNVYLLSLGGPPNDITTPVCLSIHSVMRL